MIYPPAIVRILDDLRHADNKAANCVGKDANFSCGCVVRIGLAIDLESRIVREAKFVTNGCGWMVASAEIICKFLDGKELGDLHGLSDSEMLNRLGPVEIERAACVSASIAAVKAAFADFRLRQIEEFSGEKALICTCFGVTEDRIVTAINEYALKTVEQVGLNTNAGTGCGSCRMLIQEIIDA